MVALSEKKIITVVLSSQYCVILEAAKKRFALTAIVTFLKNDRFLL